MPKRPPLQFSVRHLLVVMTLAAVLFATLRSLGVTTLIALLQVGLAGGVAYVATWCFLALRQSVVDASNDPTSPRCIASVPTDVEAAIIVSDLARHGISAHAIGGFTSGFQAESPGDVRVVVSLADAERAEKILSDLQAQQRDGSK